jgi:hypothetical protein
LRIHRHEEKLYSQHFEKINASDIRKGFFRPKFRIERLSMKPDILLFPEFSQASYVKEIPKEEAVNRAIMLSYLPQELGDYALYRHLYNLLDTRFSPWVSVYQTLKELLARTRCYRFGVVKTDSIDANYRRLKEALWGRS